MIKTISILVLSALFFSGCISLTKELPSYKTYTLSLKEDNSKSKYFDKTIHVFEPKALSSINTKAINYSKNSFEQEKYALSQWSDRPTKMLQQVIANYLVSKNSYKYITTSSIKVDTDYRLVSQLVDFRHTFTKSSSYADFSIRVYLINNKTEKVFFKSFTYNRKSKFNNAQGVVMSLNDITNSFLLDLNTFISKSLENN